MLICNVPVTLQRSTLMFVLAHTHFAQGVLSKGWNFTCSYVVLVVFLPSRGMSPLSPEAYLSLGEKGVNGDRHLQVLTSHLPEHISFVPDRLTIPALHLWVWAAFLQSVAADNSLCFLIGKAAVHIVGPYSELITSVCTWGKIAVFKLWLCRCLSGFAGLPIQIMQVS